jgi:predicted small secreted protein
MNRPTTLSRLLFTFTLVALAGFGAVALTACNTTQGVGEDIEAAGDAISDTARDAKN